MASKHKQSTIPLPAPATHTIVSADYVATGLPIPAIERIKLFSNVQWEEFILEWADSLRQVYHLVERCGGAGDMGRDVVATCKDDHNQWDNYQCKHYGHPLFSSDIWVEIGKLIYHTRQKNYTYPRKYYFVAPQGAGTTLSKLLKKPDQLRNDLKANWDTHCRGKITSTKKVELDSELSAYIDQCDFSIFGAVPPLRALEGHRRTCWHAARFGGGLPERPPPTMPPAVPALTEAGYVRCLLDAYADHLKRAIAAPTDLEAEQILKEHFSDSRLEFYSAESLRSFSRDTLPPGEFEKLQDEVFAGIRDDIRAAHTSGYARVLAVVKTARALQLTGHALNTRIGVRDRGGICHQLANDKKANWVR